MTVFIKCKGIRYRILSRLKCFSVGKFFPCILALLISMSGGCIDSQRVAEQKVDKEGFLASIEEYKSENEEQQKRIVDSTQRAAEPLAVQKGIEEILAERRESEKEIDDLEIKLRSKMAMLEACQKSFEIGIYLKPGEKFESIRLKDGRELKGAVYKGFGDKKVRFSYSDGIGAFPIEMMPESISKYISIPPSTPLSGVNPEVILARRPDVLKSNARIQRDYEKSRDAQIAASRLGAKRETEKREKQREEEMNKSRSEQALANVKRKENEARKAEIQNELNRYQSGRSSLQNSFSEKQASWSRGAISVSKADQQRAINNYNSQLRAVDQKISALQGQISKLGY